MTTLEAALAQAWAQVSSAAMWKLHPRCQRAAHLLIKAIPAIQQATIDSQEPEYWEKVLHEIRETLG